MSLVSRLLQSLTRHQRNIWIIVFLLVATFFSAKAVNRFIAYRYLPLEVGSTRMSPPSPTATWQRGQIDVPLVLSRNLFDSTANERQPPPPPEPEVDESEIRPSTISADLLGTVVFTNPRFSVALIRNRSDNSASYFGIGDEILNTTVVRIERFRVIIRRDNRLESLELQGAEAALAPSQPTRRSVQPQASPQTSEADFEEIGPGRFLIPQNTVDGLLADLPSILRDARAVPNVNAENQIEGFRLVEIRPESIYDRLGLQNGDIVMSVNDDDLDSVEKGMSLFTALRNENSISIDIVRNGSRLNYTYEIR